MGTQTGTAITYEDLMNVVVEMTYQRAKPLFEEYLSVRNQQIATVAEMVTCLVQEIETMCGITHTQAEDADEDSTDPDETEDTDEDGTEPDEAVEPDENENTPEY